MPNQGSIKINTDGSYIDYNDKAGIGGIPRNCNGDFVFAFAILYSAKIFGGLPEHVPYQCGREKTRWTVKKDAGVDFCIDEVIAVTRDGAIRIGLNTGGGVATFAGVKVWGAVLA
ncbi:hypothetical protein KY290_010129 [Solanum tuberosum]|uniref:RNase H family protein n=1 Tax=Solanum tuberosum TaxID=4113 RepID=A0ABQ7VWY2_SOLTU|nr:hypothetical protein KY289_010511 [Solanum tuberosum]KAH0772992.1 hypothetical protein KY290_010129 [Solanum tuberosum]